MPDKSRPLAELRAEFRRTSTASMPLAGTILWMAAALASLALTTNALALAIAFGSGLIFPLAILLDRLRGRNLMSSGWDNPLLANFMGGIVTIALAWPLVIIAGSGGSMLIVLGAAVLMALVWISYGWCADDPAGMRHAIGRSAAAYAASLDRDGDLRGGRPRLCPLLRDDAEGGLRRRGSAGGVADGRGRDKLCRRKGGTSKARRARPS